VVVGKFETSGHDRLHTPPVPAEAPEHGHEH
jgi:hypothetical protein